MTKLKTTYTNSDPIDFINSVEDEVKRKDALQLLQLFEQITGEKGKKWGTSIIGFGSYHYKSERSTQEGDWPLTGFSPRKTSLTVYIMPGFDDFTKELKQLGKHKLGKSCLYIKKIDDISIEILEQIITKSLKIMKKRYNKS